MLFTSKSSQRQKGFTLLEVLLVVAIIAILAGIVIIAINPNKQLGDSRNAQRRADVTTILNAVYQYYLDTGTVPGTPAPSTTVTEICKSGGSPCTGLIDLTVLTTNGKYLVSLPIDRSCPTNCAAQGNGYRISKDANNRITVDVVPTNVESGVGTISVTR